MLIIYEFQISLCKEESWRMSLSVFSITKSSKTHCSSAEKDSESSSDHQTVNVICVLTVMDFSRASDLIYLQNFKKKMNDVKRLHINLSQFLIFIILFNAVSSG